MAERIQIDNPDILTTSEQLLDKAIIDNLIEDGRIPITFSLPIGSYSDETREIQEKTVYVCSVPPKGATHRDKVMFGHELQGTYCEFVSPNGESRGKPLDFELNSNHYLLVTELIRSSLKDHGLALSLRQRVHGVMNNLHLL